MIRSVLAYAENWLRLDPVPLDRGRREPAEFDALLNGLPGETVARFAFLQPHTSMGLMRQILDRME